MTGFGERLKKLRRDADITQSELAAHLGVVPSAVGKYERIPDAYPSVEALIKIAEFFNVSIDYLLHPNRTGGGEQHQRCIEQQLLYSGQPRRRGL